MSLLTPHGKGFSFLDSFTLLENPPRGLGTKWLDPALPFFSDHFPGRPLMPAVLLIECAAQTSGALWGSLQGSPVLRRFVLAQVLQFKILRSVLPGETVKTEVTCQTTFGQLAQFEVTLTVADQEVARGKIVLGNAPDSGAV